MYTYKAQADDGKTAHQPAHHLNHPHQTTTKETSNENPA